MRRTGFVQGKLEGDAMLSWQIGAVKITCVVETLIPFPEGILLQEATLEALKASPWLFPHFANEDGSLVASVHALLVGAPGLRLVVDTCIGNDKPRHMLGTESSNSFRSANESRSPDPIVASRDRLDDLWRQKRQVQRAPDITHVLFASISAINLPRVFASFDLGKIIESSGDRRPSENGGAHRRI
jgi:hypothetical protein